MTDRPPIDWERIEAEYRAGRGHYPRGEAGAVQIIKLLLETGRLAQAFGLPEILRSEWEFSLPRGRVDFALFHIDGSISLLEVKAVMVLRDILGGIGQLMSYEAQFALSCERRLVRSILAVPCDGKSDLAKDLYLACSRANVEFMPIGRTIEHEVAWWEAVSEVGGRNGAAQ